MKKLLFIAFFSPLVSFSQTPSGLVGFWPLDGDATDDGGNGYHGVSYGAISTVDRNGIHGGAMYFDGSSSINLGDIRELNLTESFTISYWLMPEATDEDFCVFSKANASSERLSAHIWSNGNSYYEVNGSSQRGYQRSEGLFQAGKWTHFTMVFDGVKTSNSEKLRIFIDGVEVGVDYAGTIQNSTANLVGIDLWLAKLGNYDDRRFRGKLDEFYIFNEALSVDEINSIITGVALPPPGPKPQLCEVVYCDGENIGIGTSSATERLVVAGTIIAQEVKVQNVPASDYVFEPDYDLKPIEEVEAFISENKHLPNIPSAEEFKENGVGLGEMDDILLRKVEELTLYVIELKKENEAQAKEIKELKSKLK